MENQVLSIEQMQELKELGIDISKASMCWNSNGRDNGFDLLPNDSSYYHSSYTIIPTFTLQDILETLPHVAIFHNSSNTGIWLLDEFGKILMCWDNYETTLMAAFNMLKWCKQNNYI